MSIKRIFIVISAIFAASAVFADNSSVTSKKYVDDLMSGYQGKLPGSGANTLMIYDNSEDGIGEKSIETTLVSNATGVPTVGAVKTGLDGKQDTITGTAGYVMTGTGNAGEVGEKPIYSSTNNYSDAFVTAEAVNNGVINAVNHSLRRVNANGELDNNGTLWEIADTVVALSYLPAGYTQLEYIESTGTQYIDTNIAGGTRVVVDVSGTPRTDKFVVYLFGKIDATGYNEGFTQYQNMWVDTYGVGNRQIFDIEYSSSGFIVNGTTITAVMRTLANNVDLGLFGPTAANRRIKGAKLYSAKIYNNDTLLRNFIPAKNPNNVIGMYDTVSGTFFTNQGNGDFTAGPPVGN